MKKLLLFLLVIFSTFAFAQRKVVRNYMPGENAEDAKQLFKKYNNEILGQAFEVEYRGLLSNDVIDVWYRSDNQYRTLNVEVQYRFNASNFSIELWTIKHTDKARNFFHYIDDKSTGNDLEIYNDIINIIVKQQGKYLAPRQ